MRNIISKFLFTLLTLTLGFGQIWADATITLADVTPSSNWYEVTGVGRVTNKKGNAFSDGDYNCTGTGYKTGSSYFTVQTYTAITGLRILATSTSARTINGIAIGDAGASSAPSSFPSGASATGSIAKNTCDQIVTINFGTTVAANKYISIGLSGNANIFAVTFISATVTKHSVEYALNGGTGTTPTQDDVAEGSKFTLHDGVTGITAPANKEFDGWHDGTTKYAGGAEYTMGTSDVTLTAQWRNETVKYAITYDVNGGESATPTSPNKAAGDVFSLAAAPTRTGYDFLGWKCNIDDVTYAAGASYTMTAAATTFTAQWKKAPMVIFDWTAASTNKIESDNTDLSTVTYGTLTIGTSVAGRLFGTNTIDKNNVGYKLGNNDVCIEIQGTSAFEAGDTVIITGKNGGSGDRCFAVAPSTTTDAVADTIMTNTIGSQTDNSIYKVVIKAAQEGTKLRVFRKAGSTMYCKAIKVIRPVKYNVNFAPGTGASGTMAAKEYPAGAEVTLPECTFTAPTDQEFDTWTSSDVTITAGKFTMPANDVTITATWKAETPKYDITYYPGANGTGTIDAAKKTKDVDFVLSSERFTRAGYLQTGWATADGGAQAYALGATYTENADLDLYPVWTELETYVAPFACGTTPSGWTFSNDGFDTDTKATVASVCTFVENSITTPKQTTGDGTSDDDVAFAKSTDAVATYDLGITTTVAALNVVLTGGSSSAFNETIEYLGADGTTVKQSYTNSLSAGNWKDNTINKTDVVGDVRYIRVHGASKWVVMKSFSVSYIETRTKYDVTFAAGTGASGSMDALHYIEGAEVVLPACTFTAPTDMEFDAWTSSDVTITDGKFTMPASNVTITATWKDAVTRFNVTFETNGGSTIPAQEVEENGHPTAVANPTKDDYVFVGWYDNADLADIHAVADITALTITADITLYAKWALDVKATKIVFSNTFDAFIDVAHNTISAFYMAGESAPTIASYIGTNIKAFPDGIVIEGNKIVLVGTDDSRKEFDLVLEAVTPLSTLEAEQTFDGTENYVKSAYGWKGDSKGWAFQKVNDADDRETKGLTREYFFFGPAKSASFVWKVSKKNSGDACVAKVYVNGTEVMDALTDNFEVTLNKNTANMVAIVSQQHNGDCGLASVKLNADYNRTEMLGAGVLGTICLDHNVPVATAQGASFYELVGKNDIGKIAFDEVVSGDLEAGVPYVFQADGDLIALLYGATSVTEPDNSGALKGTFTGETFTAEQAAEKDIYFFRDRALWSAKETGLKVLANRAWLEMGSVNPVSSPNPAPGRRRITLGVNGTNVATGLEDLEVGEAPLKVMMNGQLFILRGDKIYDATGRLVK